MPDEGKPKMREMIAALRAILCVVGVFVLLLTYCAVRLFIESGFSPESFRPTDPDWWVLLVAFALMVLILPR